MGRDIRAAGRLERVSRAVGAAGWLARSRRVGRRHVAADERVFCVGADNGRGPNAAGGRELHQRRRAHNRRPLLRGHGNSTAPGSALYGGGHRRASTRGRHRRLHGRAALAQRRCDRPPHPLRRSHIHLTVANGCWRCRARETVRTRRRWPDRVLSAADAVALASLVRHDKEPRRAALECGGRERADSRSRSGLPLFITCGP